MLGIKELGFVLELRQNAPNLISVASGEFEVYFLELSLACPFYVLGTDIC